MSTFFGFGVGRKSGLPASWIDKLFHGDSQHWVSPFSALSHALDAPGAGLLGTVTKTVKPASYNVSASGNADADSLLSGARWNTHTLSYSFPADVSVYGYDTSSAEYRQKFKGFGAAQVASTKEALGNYANVAGLTLVQKTESATDHADLRFAGSNAAPTAYAYYPNTAGKGGDAWFNVSRHWYDAPSKGNYAAFTILHEAGHALGLKHGQETTVFGALPAAHNSMEYSVMTYASYVGAPSTGGLTNEATSYAQSLMMDDIAALQVLYGPNFTSNAGDTTYKWSAATGQMVLNGVAQSMPVGNKVFLTVWDGGGQDTYDFSNYTSPLKVDLNPGAWTTVSKSQLANLSGDGLHLARGNIANALLYNGDVRSLIENAVGGSGNDLISGNQANNLLTGGAGNDTIAGNGGSDTLLGGVGFDTLTGGAGADTFAFKALVEGLDTITDFTPGSDKISISKSGFGLTLASGKLDAAHFDGGGIATHAYAEFIFNAASHTLSFDSDGTGVQAAVAIAKLSTSALLYNYDVVLV
jgi:serralysin